jgi:hypothetical protein
MPATSIAVVLEPILDVAIFYRLKSQPTKLMN